VRLARQPARPRRASTDRIGEHSRQLDHRRERLTHSERRPQVQVTQGPTHRLGRKRHRHRGDRQVLLPDLHALNRPRDAASIRLSLFVAREHRAGDPHADDAERLDCAPGLPHPGAILRGVAVVASMTYRRHLNAELASRLAGIGPPLRRTRRLKGLSSNSIASPKPCDR
jgi:hypothetical protein